MQTDLVANRDIDFFHISWIPRCQTLLNPKKMNMSPSMLGLSMYKVNVLRQSFYLSFCCRVWIQHKLLLCECPVAYPAPSIKSTASWIISLG